MIGKIFNWLGGGFFRTIGRFVAFICLGALVSYLLTRANVNLPNLFGFEYVHALALDGTITGQVQVRSTPMDRLFYKTSGYDQTTYDWDFATVISPGNCNYAVFTIQSLLYSLDTNHISEHYGSGYTASHTDTYSIYNIFVSSAQPRIQLKSSNGPWPVCELQNNLIVCPMFKQYTYDGLKIEVILPISDSSNDINWRITVSNYVNLYSTDTNAIINNQNQNTQNTINTITDANETEANSTASSFFENFSDTDHGGLSSIITAPLTTIQSMLSNTCVAPSATWQGATITLPCGDMFWGRPGADGLKSLVNVFYGGFICYYAIRRLFLLIENLKDPTYDKIEVVDL